MNDAFNVEQLAGQQIPQEIVEQLRVLGRVNFPLKPTTVSAVSTSSVETPVDEVTAEAKLNDMLDHVGEMDNLVSQLEDMIDQLTKDMNIPVTPGTAVAAAVQALGGTGPITKDIFDKALSITNHAPIMLLGQDPVLAALTGNGKLDGPYMNCDEITRGVAQAWNTADPTNYNPETPLVDTTNQIAEDFEKSKDKMILEILLMLWWNMIWPKFIVIPCIVNPGRILFANPLDALITFFMSMCGKGPFSTKSLDCLKANGPINKALNKFICFLLCIPKKIYNRYKPMIDLSEYSCGDCSTIGNCPPENKSDPSFDKKGKVEELASLMNNLNQPCATTAQYLDGVNTDQPEGFGMPPNCVDHARVILSAVMADALTPSDPTKIGITGSASISSILKQQSDQLGV